MVFAVIVVIVIFGAAVAACVINTLLTHPEIPKNDNIDSDSDGITDKIEKEVTHTDPNNPYTSGTTLDDFNAIYTYGIDPHNQTAVNEFLAKIPNVTANLWDGDVGGTPFCFEKYVNVSMHDPLIKYLVSKSEIIWDKTPLWDGDTTVHGSLRVDGSPAWAGKPGIDTYIFESPSYYFTHGRTGTCADITAADMAILKSLGYKAVKVSGVFPGIEPGISHAWSEVLINGKVYVVEKNLICEREEFYNHCKYEPNKNYDADWYLKQ